MLRSIETWIRSSGTPRSSERATVKRIMISGPQIIAAVVRRIEAAPAMSVGTTPTWPRQPRSARVDGDVDLEVDRAAPALELARDRADRRACARRRAASRAP